MSFYPRRVFKSYIPSQPGGSCFLTEEMNIGKQTITQISFWLDPKNIQELNTIASAANLQKWLIQNVENRPLVIDHNNETTYVPISIKNIEAECAILIPLVTYPQHENSVIGCLYLSRRENIPYSQDEVIRLTTIANQIATLIDSNRRKQFSIALSERQRLLRDLHDSVSQKLYGLVALQKLPRRESRRDRDFSITSLGAYRRKCPSSCQGNASISS